MKPKSLFWRLFFSLILLGFVSISVGVYYGYQTYESLYVKEVKNNLLESSNIARRILYPYLKEKNHLELQNQVSQLIEVSSTRYTIYGSHGNVVADSYLAPNSIENQRSSADFYDLIQLKKARYISDIPYDEIEFLETSLPMRLDDGKTWVLRVGYPTGHIKNHLNNIITKLIAKSLLLFLGFVAIVFILGRFFTNPISKIALEARGLRKGHFHRRITSEYYLSKETSQIIRSFNRLAAKLDKRDRQITTQASEMESMLSAMGEGLLAVDENMNVLFINPAAKQILEIHSTDHPTETLPECTRRIEVIEFVRDALRKKGQLTREIAIENEIGTSWLLASSHPFETPEEHRPSIVLLLKNVTEIKTLENYRKDFVANVSHELRTPLTSIRGFSETLWQMTREKDGDISRFAAILMKQSERLQNLVNDILLLSQMESHAKEILNDNAKYHMLSSLIHSSIELCKKRAKEKNIDIEVTIQKDGKVTIVLHLMEQVLVNLINNATTYSSNNSKIQIVVRHSEDFSEIDIIDHGVGIASSHLPRIFERFYRVDHGRDRQAGGTGLGLAIVKHIITLHGGSISVQSEPGKGSHFKIILPTQKSNRILTLQ